MVSREPPLPDRHDSAEREAARLRYELSRLRAKRSVRLALLATKGTSPRQLLATLRGTRVEADLDVIPPATVPWRPAHPHLRVAHASSVGPFGWAAPHIQVSTPAELAAADADLFVIDGRPGPLVDSSELASAAHELDLPVVQLVAGEDRPTALAADLMVAVTTPGAESGVDAGLVVAPWVDATSDNPIGWRLDDPAVVIEAGGDPLLTARAVLAGLARGRVVVTPEPSALPESIRPYVIEGTQPAAADALFTDPDERERHSIRARRLVHSEFEALPRFEKVLDALGIPGRPAPRISVLLATRRPDQLAHALEQVERQDHPRIELVLLLHGEGFDADTEDRARAVTSVPLLVHRVPGSARFGDVLNIGLDAATGELVAKMDDDDHYGPRHLSDLVLSLRYSQADIVGRWANDVYVVSEDITVTRDRDREERWAHHLPGGTLLAHADLLRALRFRRVDRAIDTHLMRSLHDAGGCAYATHRFGYIRTRRSSDHTHEAHREASGASAVRTGLDLSVLDA
jgi:hypothetical protein